MWLLDVNMPRKVALLLGEFGIKADSADERSWGGFTNGALVKAAAEAGFDCVLTRNRLFGEAAARTLKQFPKFCVVLVNIPQLRGPEFLEHFRSAWSREPITLVAGKLLRWPTDYST